MALSHCFAFSCGRFGAQHAIITPPLLQHVLCLMTDSRVRHVRRSRKKGHSGRAGWRLTHASSIKRIQPDQVARQLRATIVPRDNSGIESALSPLSSSLFAFLPPFFFTDNKSTFFYFFFHCTPKLVAWAGPRS